MYGIFRYLKPAFIAIPYSFGCYMRWLYKFSRHPEKYPLELRHKKMMNAFQHITKYLDVELHVEGLENIPKDENVVIVGNHIGDYDPMSVSCLIEPITSFVAKAEAIDMPLISSGLKALDGVFMNRSDLKQSLKCMQQVQKELQEERKNWIIFPEGTRRKDSGLLMADFHSGTFRAPTKAGVKIIPFAIVGTDRIFHLHPKTYRKYPVHIKFLEPVTPEIYKDMTTEEVARYCHDQVERAIAFDLRRKDHDMMCKMYPKKYKAL